MAVLHRPHRHTEVHPHDAGSVVDERQTASAGDGLNAVLRTIGAVAGGVATVIGIVALLRIDWSAGLDSAPADVAGMLFTPVVAIATTVLGLVALAAGAAADRGSKLVVGALLVCVGLGVLIAGDSRADWDLESGHGWLALVIGGVLVITGALMRRAWTMHRTVREEGYRS